MGCTRSLKQEGWNFTRETVLVSQRINVFGWRDGYTLFAFESLMYNLDSTSEPVSIASIDPTTVSYISLLSLKSQPSRTPLHNPSNMESDSQSNTPPTLPKYCMSESESLLYNQILDSVLNARVEVSKNNRGLQWTVTFRWLAYFVHRAVLPQRNLY